MYTVNATWEINEGQTLRIDLVLDANPIPNLNDFRWEYNGVTLVSTSEISFNLTYLDLGVVDRSEAGIYFVEAENVAGTGNATFEVIVYCKTLLCVVACPYIDFLYIDLSQIPLCTLLLQDLKEMKENHFPLYWGSMLTPIQDQGCSPGTSMANNSTKPRRSVSMSLQLASVH